MNLSALAREIAEELKTRDPNRQVEFTIADHVFVQGDERILRLALQNLLANAWKFSSTRDVARIEFGIFQAGELGAAMDKKKLPGDPPTGSLHAPSVTYFIRDNGVGFDMAYADKLFAPFQRLHAMNEFPGTGIGLAIVKRVLARHGGRIWPEAQVDQGATFYFTIGGE